MNGYAERIFFYQRKNDAGLDYQGDCYKQKSIINVYSNLINNELTGKVITMYSRGTKKYIQL